MFLISNFKYVTKSNTIYIYEDTPWDDVHFFMTCWDTSVDYIWLLLGDKMSCLTHSNVIFCSTL